MDEFIKGFIGDQNVITSVTMVDMLLGVITSFLLSFILSVVYVKTHSGYSYSRTYVHSLVFVAVTVALIMLIIGSNIARAFALVGAMSIVRFRNPVKDTKDLTFIFMAIAIGMACGTRFYGFAIIYTVLVLLITAGFSFFGFGLVDSRTYVLRINMISEQKKIIESVLQSLCTSFYVISLDQRGGETLTQEVVYEVELARKTKYSQLVKEISEAADNVSCSLLVGENSVSA